MISCVLTIPNLLFLIMLHLFQLNALQLLGFNKYVNVLNRLVFSP